MLFSIILLNFGVAISNLGNENYVQPMQVGFPSPEFVVESGMVSVTRLGNCFHASRLCLPAWT